MAKGPGGLAILLGEPDEHEDEHEDGGDVDHEKAKTDAVDELIDCIKSGDREGAHKAFAMAHALHSMDDDESTPDLGGDEEDDPDDGDVHLD